jgi:hypothetical protein
VVEGDAVLITQLLPPEVYARLDTRDLEILKSAIDAQLLTNEVIRKELEKTLKAVVPHLGKGPATGPVNPGT